MVWKVEESELLDQLVAEGCDIVTMQQRMGKTKEAIRSKLKRMGVTVILPPKPEKPAKQPRRKKPVVSDVEDESAEVSTAAPKPARKTKPRPVLPVLPVLPEYERKLYPIEKIGPKGCQWPIGDLRQGDFHFCGADRHGSGPYCRDHHRIAFNGTQVTRVPEKV